MAFAKKNATVANEKSAIGKGSKRKSKSKAGGLPRYGTYIQKAFAEIKESNKYPEFKNLTISANALSAGDMLIDHFLDLLSANAKVCCRYAKNGKDAKSGSSLQTKHMQAAVETAVSGRLATKTLKSATRAVRRYNESFAKASGEVEQDTV